MAVLDSVGIWVHSEAELEISNSGDTVVFTSRPSDWGHVGLGEAVTERSQKLKSGVL